MSDTVAAQDANKARMFSDVVCPFCGTGCDDIEIHVEEGRIKTVENACAMGKAAYAHYQSALATPRIHGRPATIEQCIDAAADILAAAKYPLIYGLDSTELSAQRKAVQLAELIGANIDHSPSVSDEQAIMQVGIPTCTVGEIKNRADLVIFWGCNPVEAYPRHAARYSVTAAGLFTAMGRRGRTIITVDVRPTPLARIADMAFQIRPNADYEIATTLLAILNGHEPDRPEVGGIAVAEWRALVDEMKRCNSGIICWGTGITMSRGKIMNTIAILKLTHALNRFTKFVAMPMRGHGNVAGTNQVLTWQTGYPFAVNMSRGYPRYNPGEFSIADLLIRKEVDAAMIIAADAVGHLPGQSAAHLRSIPLVAIDPKESDTTKVATVVIPVAQAGVAAGGMSYRMDRIPLKMKKVVDSPWPTDYEVLTRIVATITAKQKDRSGIAAA